jgi:hypothetical protein
MKAMTHVSARVMVRSLIPNNNLINTTLSNTTVTSPLQPVPPLDNETITRSKLWFSRILAGYNWTRTKIGRFFHGPTFDMTPAEIDAWKVAQDRAHSIAYLEKENEAEFKTALYMIENYPGYYYAKYVEPFEPGSEERRRAVFTLVLHNKQLYGDYYGVFRPEVLDAELAEMGTSLKSNNMVHEIVGSDADEEILGLRKRNGSQDIFHGLSGDNVMLVDDVQRRLADTDMSSLIVRMKKPQPIAAQGRKRHINLNDQELSTFARFD